MDVEESRTQSQKKQNNVLPLWGNEKTMNLNSMILTNVLSSPYFKNELFQLKTYHEVVDEIYYKVDHLEPWEKGSRKTSGQVGMCGGVRGVGAGGIVSTSFCLLYKLFTLKLTRKQLNGLITHVDSPYIRALGFMFIRYCQPPAKLWEWMEPYLEDEEFNAMNFVFLLPLFWYGDTSLISVEQLDTDTGVGDHCDTRRSPKGCITLLNGGETLGLVQVGSQAIKSQNTTKLSAKDADGHARYAQHARTEVVKHFAIVQTASQTAAAMKGVQDFNDGAIVFLSMLFVLVLYLVAGAQLGFGSEESVDSQLQNFYQRTTSWVMPRMEALQELLPCISSNLVGPTADMPLLVPVKALEEREKCQRMLSNLKGWGSPALPENVAWQFDITSICGQKVLAVQQVKLQDGQLGPIQVLGHRGSGRGKCLGSIDRKLQLVSGVGEDFGRLVRKQSGAYELKESATGRHRWLVQANMHFPGHEYFTVTWRPRRRLLATLNRGQGGHADYMKVMPTPGVDVVLVILCCVGLFVFRIDDQVEGQSMEEDPEAAGSGFAGNLLQNADGADD